MAGWAGRSARLTTTRERAVRGVAPRPALPAGTHCLSCRQGCGWPSTCPPARKFWSSLQPGHLAGGEDRGDHGGMERRLTALRTSWTAGLVSAGPWPISAPRTFCSLVP